MSELVLVNPRRKRRKTTRKKAVRRNPVKRKRATRRRAAAKPTRRRRVRRNPKLSFKSVTKNTLMPSAIGAGGAIGLDIIFGALPIPAQFKSGAMGSVAKIIGAIVLGKFAGKVIGKAKGDQVTAGAVTVLAYDAFKKGLAQYAPGLPLSEYVPMGGSDFAYNPYPNLGYMNAGEAVNMGEYVGGGQAGGDTYVPSDGMGEHSYDYS